MLPRTGSKNNSAVDMDGSEVEPFLALGGVRHVLNINRIRTIDELCCWSAPRLLHVGLRKADVARLNQFLGERGRSLTVQAERRVSDDPQRNRGRRASDRAYPMRSGWSHNRRLGR